MEGNGVDEPRRFSGAAAASSSSGGSELAVAAPAAPRQPTIVRRVMGQQVRSQLVQKLDDSASNAPSMAS